MRQFVVSSRFMSFFVGSFLTGVFIGSAASGQDSAQPVQSTTGEVSTPQRSGSINGKVSEFSFQAPKGRSVFEVAPKYGTSDRSFGSGPSAIRRERSEAALGMLLSYGFSDLAAISLNTTYGEEESRRTGRAPLKYRGFSDFEFNLRGFRPMMERSRLTYGLGYSLSPEKGAMAWPGRTGNRHSGGNAVLTRLGFETDLMAAPVTMGVAARYNILGEAQSEAKTDDGTVFETGRDTGANQFQLSGFTEYLVAENRLGLSLNYISIESMKSVDSVGGVGDIRYTSDPYSLLALQTYGRFRVDEGFELKPQISYETLLTRELNGLRYESWNSLQFQLTARIAL